MSQPDRGGRARLIIWLFHLALPLGGLLLLLAVPAADAHREHHPTHGSRYSVTDGSVVGGPQPPPRLLQPRRSE